ncbi:MAG: PilZ domain-containing protein [Vibrionaceae bacterium]|nr:PilZ domain-containing protein [Vibrionaceae bacterium]
MSAVEQRRQFYRLKYPRRAMPSVRFSQERFRVSELSEGGMRIVMNGFTKLQVGTEMKGLLSLHNGCEIAVEGTVLRFAGEEVVIQFDKGPSFKHMVDEQRNIRNNYPIYFERVRSGIYDSN